MTIRLQRWKYSKNIPATHYYILLFPTYTLAEEQQTKITVAEVSMFSSFWKYELFWNNYQIRPFLWTEE